MKSSQAWIAVAWMLLCGPLSPATQQTLFAQQADEKVDSAALRRKQETQQRARKMARELVSSILDIQLQQLSENGLEDLPLFRDIKNMRVNIDGLVEAEMRQVVDLLIKAQEQSSKEREQTFINARQKIRQVVVRLSIERQNLLRRLKTAEIAAQAKRLIEMQTVVLSVTRTLPEQPPTKQETATLSTIQDQRDVKELFLQLVETLVDVRTWGGQVGNGAGEGLLILKAGRVGEALDNAGQHLEASEFIATTEDQQTVIKGLRLLIDKIDETQGLIGTDREAALELVRELIERQEQVRQLTKQTNLTEEKADALVSKEAAIQKDLGKLADALQQIPSAMPLLEQAKAAAREATGKLFDAQPEEAATEQGKVLGNLSEIEEQLRNAADLDKSDKTAEELAQLVKELEKTKEELKQIEKEQVAAEKKAEKEPAAAKKQEDQVAAKLAKTADDHKLPVAIESRLQQAKEAVEEAAKALDQSAANEKAAERQEMALESADEAIERAAAEVEAALADAKRKGLGSRSRRIGARC